MRIRLAEDCDREAVSELYRTLCEQQKDDEYTPHWVWGLHPTEQMLQDHILSRELWVAEDSSGLCGAMVLCPNQDCLELHLLGILKSRRKSGLSGRFMSLMEQEARSRRFQRLGLEVLAGNVPAEALYRRRGFVKTETHREQTEDGDLILLDWYEKLIL